MVAMHAKNERGLSMNHSSQIRMTNDETRRNDEIQMTKPATAQLRVFDIRASDSFRHSSFVIRHSTLCASQVHGPNACLMGVENLLHGSAVNYFSCGTRS